MNDSTTKMYYVYTLNNPLDNNRIFYVGVTSQPSRRLTAHTNHPDPVPNPKDRLIKCILAKGAKPTMTILDSFEATMSDALVIENYWILELLYRGEKLLNRKTRNKYVAPKESQLEKIAHWKTRPHFSTPESKSTNSDLISRMFGIK